MPKTANVYAVVHLSWPPGPKQGVLLSATALALAADGIEHHSRRPELPLVRLKPCRVPETFKPSQAVYGPSPTPVRCHRHPWFAFSDETRKTFNFHYQGSVYQADASYGTTIVTGAKRFYDICESSVFRYGPPEILLLDSETQFASRLFQNFCQLVGLYDVSTLVRHPQTTSKARLYSRTPLAVLQNYVIQDWNRSDICLSALTYS